MDRNFGAFLARLATGNDEADIDQDAYAYLFAVLTQFVEKVLMDIVITHSIEFADKRRTASLPTFSLTEDRVRESLKRCGYAELTPKTEMMGILVKKFAERKLAGTLVSDAEETKGEINDSDQESMNVDSCSSPGLESGSDLEDDPGLENGSSSEESSGSEDSTDSSDSSESST
ncbi:hypothetical protein J3B02_003858 [Coemansia erecta]|nr:hypothetical protein J3B02_003858 [Coemansia erecta]